MSASAPIAGEKAHARCFNCHAVGHISSECHVPAQLLCYNCNQVGHKAPACTVASVCRVCLRPGHKERQCPRQNVGGNGRPKRPNRSRKQKSKTATKNHAAPVAIGEEELQQQHMTELSGEQGYDTNLGVAWDSVGQARGVERKYLRENEALMEEQFERKVWRGDSSPLRRWMQGESCLSIEESLRRRFFAESINQETLARFVNSMMVGTYDDSSSQKNTDDEVKVELVVDNESTMEMLGGRLNTVGEMAGRHSAAHLEPYINKTTTGGFSTSAASSEGVSRGTTSSMDLTAPDFNFNSSLCSEEGALLRAGLSDVTEPLGEFPTGITLGRRNAARSLSASIAAIKNRRRATEASIALSAFSTSMVDVMDVASSDDYGGGIAGRRDAQSGESEAGSNAKRHLRFGNVEYCDDHLLPLIQRLENNDLIYHTYNNSSSTKDKDQEQNYREETHLVGPTDLIEPIERMTPLIEPIDRMTPFDRLESTLLGGDTNASTPMKGVYGTGVGAVLQKLNNNHCQIELELEQSQPLHSQLQSQQSQSQPEIHPEIQAQIHQHHQMQPRIQPPMKNSSCAALELTLPSSSSNTTNNINTITASTARELVPGGTMVIAKGVVDSRHVMSSPADPRDVLARSPEHYLPCATVTGNAMWILNPIFLISRDAHV